MKRFIKTFFEVLIIVLAIAFILAFDWGVTVGVVYLAALCFGLDATLLIATGVWIVVLYLKTTFGSVTKPSKKGEV